MSHSAKHAQKPAQKSGRKLHPGCQIDYLEVFQNSTAEYLNQSSGCFRKYKVKGDKPDLDFVTGARDLKKYFDDLLVYQLQIVKNFTAIPSNRRDYIYQ